MFRFLVISACVYAVALCAPGHSREAGNDHEGSATGHFESIASIGDDVHGGYGGKQGFSAGSGLRNIAQGSAEQANNAVVNQHAAARQAAFVAKSSIAQVAVGAAATAQAALVGKQILIQRLDQQVQEAHQQLEAETQQLQQAQRSAAASQAAAQQAQQQVNALNAAVNSAQGTVVHATQAAEAAALELGSQSSMVGVAKQRLSTLSQELANARGDFEATQAAAQRAESSAQIAQSNAAQAAASASESAEHGNIGGGAHGFADEGLDGGHY